MRARIIGAGFSGLATAYWLSELGVREILIVDRDKSRAGGMLQTHRPSPETGPSEAAANAFLSNWEIEQMAQASGVTLEPTLKASRVRLVFRGGRARRWPLEPGESAATMARSLRAVATRNFAPRDHESLAGWADRVLGAEASRYLVSPAFQGVYGTDGKNLSAKLILKGPGGTKPKSAGRARLRGSVAPRLGMGEFQAKLVELLKSRGCEFRLDREIFDLTEFRRARGDIVIVATPLWDAATLVSGIAPELGARMAALPVLPLASVNAFFKAHDRHHRAFGCLFPRGEEVAALGVLLNNYIFPDRGPALSETWIYGGEAALESPEALRARLLADRHRLAPSSEGALMGLLTHSWPRALPLYGLELKRFLESAPFESFKKLGIRFIGNYLGTIGLAKIAVRARELAAEIVTSSTEGTS